MAATGIFGGSFDPVHHGHLIVAARAAEALGLETVLFVPVGVQPLKAAPPVAGAEHRAAMIRLAIAGDRRFALEGGELDRPGPSYTVDTLRQLAARRPGARLVLIVGADAAAQLPRWREADEVARLAEIAVLRRAGAPPVSSPLVRHQVATPAIEISASDIRARVKAGRDIRYVVPATVAEYIERHGLYR